MYFDMSGLPIMQYENVVEPIAPAARGAGLDRRDRRDSLKERRRGSKRPRKPPGNDGIVANPFVGLLFDLDA